MANKKSRETEWLLVNTKKLKVIELTPDDFDVMWNGLIGQEQDTGWDGKYDIIYPHNETAKGIMDRIDEAIHNEK